MTVLVTGGAGFIGSHLVEELLNQGKEVIVLDNLSVGKYILRRKNYDFIKGDVTNLKIFSKLPHNVDIVFHLAALTDARESIKKPNLYFKVNVTGSFNILEFCRKNDAKIVFTSSAAVYGDYKRPVKEDDTCRPLSPYGEYKLIVEELIKRYNKFYGVTYTIFRIFNVYGPRANSGVIKNLIEALLNNKPFYLYGDGKQKRDFIYVKDVIEVLVQHNKVNNIILNIGTGKSTSLLELIKLCNKLKVKKCAKQEGDIDISITDISKLKQYFPDLEFVNVKKGLKLVEKGKS